MRRPLLVLLAGISMLLDCRAGPGSSCEKGEARCVDKKNELICQDGRYIQAPCKGSRGCGLTPQGVRCDISGNAHGDPCSTDEEGASACADDKTSIVCAGGKLALHACRGPRGCRQLGNQPHCDTTVAEPGDGCREADKTRACSADGRQVLGCRSGKMTMQFQCLGPGGCKSEDGKLNCDMSYARDKDPCLAEMEGKIACNLDHSSIVVCKGGRFLIQEECKEGKRCLGEGTIRCEKVDQKKD